MRILERTKLEKINDMEGLINKTQGELEINHREVNRSWEDRIHTLEENVRSIFIENQEGQKRLIQLHDH